MQNTLAQLLTTLFTCVEMLCGMRHNTIDTFVIQRDANKLRGILQFSREQGVAIIKVQIEFQMHKYTNSMYHSTDSSNVKGDSVTNISFRWVDIKSPPCLSTNQGHKFYTVESTEESRQECITPR